MGESKNGQTSFFIDASGNIVLLPDVLIVKSFSEGTAASFAGKNS
jgi:hypothetical protein